jgi:hydrogenase maturation protein HypF
METAAIHITISGTVQGFGFRPFVYKMAQKHRVGGFVCNSLQGVEIDASGRPSDLERFAADLQACPPPLARIAGFKSLPLTDAVEYQSFEIKQSRLGDQPQLDITRDSATCEACVSELRSADDRRHRHAFINCTDCGPRYSIIKGLPYDRAATTMAPFEMCPACRAEYENPADRRFHAQPVCCPRCGPQLQLLDNQGNEVSVSDPVTGTIARLVRGEIMAVKGLGGFHLACRADLDQTVALLRQRKRREQKPLAIMARDLAAAGRYALISDREAGLLQSIERPIVILEKNPGAPSLAAELAPRVNTLGIMLPYTPLHHLLFDTADYDVLVMTSANLSSEPICIDTAEAVAKLNGIADGYLTHNRLINVRMDDSIVRTLAGEPVLLRRSRGYVPDPLPADCDVDGIVALGGIMKATVTVGRGSSCYVSQYLGSADSVATLESRDDTLRHLLGLLGVKPELQVCDLHPLGLTAGGDVNTVDNRLIRVQHHHAHAVACMAENRVSGKAVCVVYDGLGLGEDGTIWGGEILIADRSGYQRFGHWKVGPMPGGDAATLNPGRMAIGALWARLGREVDGLCPWMAEDERRAAVELVAADVNCPVTSSMGRLFDAAAAILDVCRRQSYEGQPAIELEGRVDRYETGSYDVPLERLRGSVRLDGPALLLQVLQDRLRGEPVGRIAARFHRAIAGATAQAALAAAAAADVETVCLSGGCFMNAILAGHTISLLKKAGLNPLVHRILSPGDECVSFGQAIIAASRRK